MDRVCKRQSNRGTEDIMTEWTEVCKDMVTGERKAECIRDRICKDRVTDGGRRNDKQLNYLYLLFGVILKSLVN